MYHRADYEQESGNVIYIYIYICYTYTSHVVHHVLCLIYEMFDVFFQIFVVSAVILFKLLFEEIAVKSLNFTCRWMPSHSAQKGTELPPDVSPMDVIGNDFADKQADLAAAYHVISLNASSIALWYG